jgi:hypothetical protein
MEHVELYRDHRINAWTEDRDGAPCAFFTIDEETLVAWPVPGAPEVALLQAAVAEARRRVDGWPRG